MIRPVLEAVARIGRRPVRTVRPEPPHDPEPHEDEPFAPAYRGFVPLTTARDPYAGWVPARTDPLVFGPPGATELQGGRITRDGLAPSCPCGVTWSGEGGCWACEEPEQPKQPESWFTPADKPAPDGQEDDKPRQVQAEPQRWDRL